MLSQEFVKETINKYITLEETTLKKINEIECSDEIGSEKWRLKNNCNKRINLLKNVLYDLTG
jgi:hypothetical protein